MCHFLFWKPLVSISFFLEVSFLEKSQFNLRLTLCMSHSKEDCIANHINLWYACKGLHAARPRTSVLKINTLGIFWRESLSNTWQSLHFPSRDHKCGNEFTWIWKENIVVQTQTLTFQTGKMKRDKVSAVDIIWAGMGTTQSFPFILQWNLSIFLISPHRMKFILPVLIRFSFCCCDETLGRSNMKGLLGLRSRVHGWLVLLLWAWGEVE